MSTNVRFKMLRDWTKLPEKGIEGEIAYDVDSNGYYIYNGTVWEKLLLDSDKQRKHSTICPRCGAPCSPYQEKCDYCDSYFEF